VSKLRLLWLISGALALVTTPAGSAGSAPAPTGEPVAEFAGSFFSSRSDGPAEVDFLLAITSATPGPKGMTFEATYVDQFSFVIGVKGKISPKRRFSFAGTGGQQILARSGIGALGSIDPDATAKISFKGQHSGDGFVTIGTYKTTYKKLDVAGASPFKDYGGFYMELSP